MKKLLFIFFLFFSLRGLAQFPINATTGTSTSTVLTRGISAADSAFQYRTNFSDTSIANLGLLDQVAGVVIRTNDTLFWVRNSTLNRWVPIGSGGGSTALANMGLTKSGSNIQLGQANSDATSASIFTTTRKILVDTFRLVLQGPTSGSFPTFQNRIEFRTADLASHGAQVNFLGGMGINTYLVSGTGNAFPGLSYYVDGVLQGAWGLHFEDGVPTAEHFFIDGRSNTQYFAFEDVSGTSQANFGFAPTQWTTQLGLKGKVVFGQALAHTAINGDVDNIGSTYLRDSLTLKYTPFGTVDSVLAKDANDLVIAVPLSAVSTNIYNSNGSLSGTRTLTGAGNSLSFSGVSNFSVDASATTSNGMDLIVNTLTSGIGLHVRHSANTFSSGTLLQLSSTSTGLAAGNEGLNIDFSGTNGTSAITATGARISVANGGTTSTNVALSLSATNGTTANYALIVPASSGNVGIGTSTPSSVIKLHVVADAGTVGVGGFSTSSDGVYGEATNGVGVLGVATSSNGIGVRGEATGVNTNNFAGQFVAANGTNNYAITVPSASGKVGFGTNTPTAGMLHIVSPTTTGTTTTSGIVIESNSLTSGTGIQHSSTSLTSGKLENIVSTSTVLAASNTGLNIDFSGANGTNAITATGITVGVTNTNATSGSNYGITIGASGATTSNRSLNITAGDIYLAGGGQKLTGAFSKTPTGDGFEIDWTSGTNTGNIRSYRRTASAYGNILFESLTEQHNSGSGGTNTMLLANGRVFFGGSTSPTALVHIGAGTATASTAPLKFVTGTSLTVAEAGAMEYTTPQLFFTNGGGQRQELFQGQQSRVSTQFDKTDQTLANITGLTATLVASGVYRFRAELYTTSDVAGGIKIAIGGTATATSIVYDGFITDAGVTTQARSTTIGGSGGAVTAVVASHCTIIGTIVVANAGSLTCQAARNAASGTTSILVGSTFVVTQIL